MAVLLYGESSALWGGFLSERSERNQRTAGGSRNRTGGDRPVLHAVSPQAPNYGGTPSRNLIHDLPADKILIIFPSCPGDTGPCLV